MREFIVSAREFFWGVFKRAFAFYIFALLDVSPLWDDIIRPEILRRTGRDLDLPSEGAWFVAAFGTILAAVQTYHFLRKERLALSAQLAPTAEIDPSPRLQPWDDKKSGPCRLYDIAITNPSATHLRGVAVLLTSIEPSVENLDWLPIPLHIKHDNGDPKRESMDINPRGLRRIDLIAKPDRRNQIEICHAVSGVNRLIPSGRYLLTVRVEGHSVAVPHEAKFLVRVTEGGQLLCLPGASVDLNKGWLNYKVDAESILPAVSRVITRIGDETARAGARTRIVGEEALKSKETPFSRMERLLGVTAVEKRIMRRSKRWSRMLDDSAAAIESAASEYDVRTAELLDNYIGFFENAPSVDPADKGHFDDAAKAIEVALDGSKKWLAAIVSNRAARVTTEVSHSIQRTENAIRHLIRVHERNRDSFRECVGIVEGRLKQ